MSSESDANGPEGLLVCSKETLFEVINEAVVKAGAQSITEAFKLLLPLMMPQPKSYIIENRLTNEAREELSRCIDELDLGETMFPSVTTQVLPDYASMWSGLKAAIDSAEYPVMQELVKVIERQHGVEVEKGEVPNDIPV